MFVLHANKTSIEVLEKEIVTTGSVNVYQCKISFSEDWDNLVKTAVFKVGNDSKSVLLTDVGTDEDTGEQFSYCSIPPQILDEYNRTLYIGLYGILGDEVILPTIWKSLGTVREGVIIGDLGVDGGSDGNSVHDQILAELSKKGDSLDYDRTSSTLTLKSGETILSAVTIVEGTGIPGEGDNGDGTITNSGVTSFNGRKGAVIPQKGDYTADMVGADPTGTAEQKVTVLREEVENSLDDKISSSGGTMNAPLQFEVSNNNLAKDHSRISPLIGSVSMQEDGLTLESSNKAIGFSGSSLKNVGVAIEDTDAVPFKQMQDHTKSVVETAVENVEIPTKLSELENDAGYATESYVDEVLSGMEGGEGVVGKDGKSAYEIAVENGFVGTESEWLESLKGKPGKDGIDGFSPTVSTELNEAKDGTVVTITDVNGEHKFTVLNGLDGLDGKDGETPYIGENGNWWIGDTDTNVSASGPQGVTFIPSVSSDGVLSWTNDGDLENPSPVEIKGSDGKSAYQIAVDNGFSGTEEEWLESLKGKDGSNEDLIAGEGIIIENNTISVATPIIPITQEDYDNLTDEERKGKLFLILDAE